MGTNQDAGRQDLERELLAVLLQRGAPALAELAGEEIRPGLLSPDGEIALQGLRTSASYGDTLSPASIEATLQRIGYNGTAGGVRALLEVALEVHGGTTDHGQALRLLREIQYESGTRKRPVEPTKIPLICADQVVETPVAWIIENFLARGELTDLFGDPGVGKGGITASWAARILSDDPQATVIFLATEDPLGRVRGRLRAEGADLARVFFLDITKPGASPCLPDDAPALEAIIREHNSALLILDPAIEFMAPDLDSHRQQDVARFMGPLLAIAQRTSSGLLTVRHSNKNVGASALYRASGSIGFVGKVRIALLASKDGETGQRALAMIKNNLGKDKYTVGYDIIDKDGASVVAWGEQLATTADELVNQEPAKKRGPPPARLEAAKDDLLEMLSRGPMQVDDIMKGAKSAHIGKTTIYEAARALGVQKCTLRMRSAWRLPSGETPEVLPVNPEFEFRTTPENSGNGVKDV